MTLTIKVAKIDATMSVNGVAVAEYHNDGVALEVQTFTVGQAVAYTRKGDKPRFAHVIRINRKSITIHVKEEGNDYVTYAKREQLQAWWRQK